MKVCEKEVLEKFVQPQKALRHELVQFRVSITCNRPLGLLNRIKVDGCMVVEYLGRKTKASKC
jgi:hypothetical protein